jgi:16S rRNA G966 N2-methylase RsmD
MAIATTLTEAERRFIGQHLTADVSQLLLHPPSTAANLDLKKIAVQLTARQKARDKLPGWYDNHALIFPPPVSVEQASSEQAARYKASLVNGSSLADLTGGMGVDTQAFAARVGGVQYVEQNPDLANLAAHNLPVLGATNVQIHAKNGLDFINCYAERFDWLYLDPHRRNGQGGRVVLLSDCEPNLLAAGVLAALLAKTNRVLLKTSPMIDLDATLRQLPGAMAVHVVAVLGEVKEVLFMVGNESVKNGDVAVTAINLLPNDEAQTLVFRREDELSAPVIFADPGAFLYEPNAAVLKSGAFKTVAARFGLAKLAPNSHLYTGPALVADFPGRAFALETVIKPDLKSVRAVLATQKANLTARNFPQTVADLRKKLGLADGGDVYLFATTLQNSDKRLLVCRKV